MGKILVKTSELKACAAAYRNLSASFDTNCNNLLKKIDEYESVWKGSFSKDFDGKVTKIKKVRKSVVKNSTELATFIDGAVEKYIQVDKGLAQSSQIGNNDYPSNVVDDSEAIPTQEELQNNIYNVLEAHADEIPNNPAKYGGTKNCVEVSKYKAKLHGFNLYGFSGLGGANGYNNIHETDSYSVTKYGGANALKELVEKEGQPITNIFVSMGHPHTIYIDKIENGIVYFSDNRNLSGAKTCSIDNFPGYKKDGKIDTSYTIGGVAHLKKK